MCVNEDWSPVFIPKDIDRYTCFSKPVISLDTMMSSDKLAVSFKYPGFDWSEVMCVQLTNITEDQSNHR